MGDLDNGILSDGISLKDKGGFGALREDNDALAVILLLIVGGLLSDFTDIIAPAKGFSKSSYQVSRCLE